MTGITIKLHLVEGTPSGVMTAEIMNWTGKIIVASRNSLDKLAKRSEMRRAGVYILVGAEQHSIQTETVYIGESDNVLDRLKIHERDERKEFWDRTIIIISKDENLTKAHVKYLESELIKLAIESDSARVANGTNPEYVSIPESDKSDMDSFLTQIQMLLPVLGVSFASPKPTHKANSSPQPNTPDSPMFILNYSGITAQAQLIGSEFVLLSNSQIRIKETGSIGLTYKEQRKKLLKDGKFTPTDNEYWVLNTDIAFNSPTAAAAVAAGASINGRLYWKTLDTQLTFTDWSLQQTEKAEASVSESVTI